jgi:hypothetical protein
MQRIIAICLTFGALSVACCFAQTERPSDAKKAADIAALQQKRIELLQQRVSQIESFAAEGIADRQDAIRPQIDLINARIEYAQWDAEKKELLSELLAEYDKLIALAEALLHAPVPPPEPGQRISHLNNHLKASSELLLLKSEHVRIQISRDLLE